MGEEQLVWLSPHTSEMRMEFSIGLSSWMSPLSDQIGEIPICENGGKGFKSLGQSLPGLLLPSGKRGVDETKPTNKRHTLTMKQFSLFHSPSVFTDITPCPLRFPSVFADITPCPPRFHTSAPLQVLSNHRLFSQIDWDKVESGLYAIVDPFAPSQILYLTENDYIIQVRVAQTNNKTLKVLATPEDTRESATTPPDTPPQADPFIESIVSGRQSATAKSRYGLLSHLFSAGFAHWKSRKDGEEQSMVRVTDRNIRTCIHRWHDVLSWWSRGSPTSTVVKAERSTFSARVQRLYRCNGIQYTILYLKACLFVINTFLAGRKILSAKEVPGKVRVRLQNGLPMILPTYVRHGLRCKNIHFIHIWTSVTNMYKGLEGKYGPVDLSTIIQSHPNLDTDMAFITLKEFIPLFWKLVSRLGGSLKPSLVIKTLFSTSKAGPAHPNAVLGAPRDASIWFKPDGHTGIRGNLILEWLEATGNEGVRKLFRVAAKRYDLVGEIISHVQKSTPLIPGVDPKVLSDRNISLIGGVDRLDIKTMPRILGRLHDLYEPAGKIRIVAIVDYWTNAVLKPLHDWMFDLLRVIPSDATFDQEGRLKEYATKGFKDAWSIDLTAATDTIPLALYRVLMGPILGEHLTSLWLELLTGRNFLHKFAKKSEREFHSPTDFDLIRYGRGQPMGALSSWSSMAMVHHLLVQFAAFLWSSKFHSDVFARDYLAGIHPDKIKSEWFEDYLILGDDLVIFHEGIAKEYLRLAEALGIKVGIQKSFISEDGFINFASQSYVDDKNVSPLSFKEFIGVDSLTSRAELALRAGRRGWFDLTSSKWIAPLCKMFLSERIWSKVQLNLNQGSSHPIVSWILSVLLVPGSQRFADSGLPRVSIKHTLSTMLKKSVIWTKPLKDLGSLSNEWKDWSLIVKILLGNVNSVYGEFLQNRKRLEAFNKWLELTMSVEGEEILQIILYNQISERLDKWIKRYRVPLKTLQVVFSLPSIQPHMLEIGSEMTLDEATTLIAEATEAMPRIPPYEMLDAAIADLRSARQSSSQRECQAFARLLALVGNVEHLHSYTTPGFKRSTL